MIETKRVKINLGCGREILKDYINLDIVQLEGIDIVHNLDEFPYPFVDNMFDEVRMKSIMEHLENVQKTLEELWRISKPNAIIIIRVPHFSSLGAFVDPTHKRFFTYYSFDYYCEDAKKEISDFSYYSKTKFKMVSRRIIYPKYLKPFEWIANTFPKFHEILLRKFLPARSLHFKLEVIK